jgi:hypothetical protein
VQHKVHVHSSILAVSPVGWRAWRRAGASSSGRLGLVWPYGRSLEVTACSIGKTVQPGR